MDRHSADYIASIGLSAHLHADFGSNPAYGIPYAVVGPRQPKVPISFSEFGGESDPGGPRLPGGVAPMPVVVTGSIATDHLMTFPGKFTDQFVEVTRLFAEPHNR